MEQSSDSNRIFLFSKTPYHDANVRHIPILDTLYLSASIDFSDYDYIIATSKEVFNALEKIGSWKTLPVIAISEATAAYAKKLGAEVLDIADGYGEGLAALICNKYRDLKALHPHAKVIAFDINSALKKEAILVASFIVYETQCANQVKIDLPYNAICIFSSPSAIKCFKNVYQLLDSYKIICIGETTAKALPRGSVYYLADVTTVKSAVMKAKTFL